MIVWFWKQFPLLSKSARLQKLLAATINEQQQQPDDEISLPDIPGGPQAFEICAKFCYGMTVTLNAYNVVAARCAAEYLEMYESVETGNLVYKIEVFLNSSVLRSWKDSIIVLQTTRSFHPWSGDAKIDARCLESIASKAAVDPARVDWSYTYNRRKLNNGVVPIDWWVDDLTELSIDLYKRVVSSIRRKGGVSPEVIGDALEVYAARRIQTDDHCHDVEEQRSLLETLISLLPGEKQSVSCGILIKLLKSSVSLECGEDVRKELSKRIGEKLEEANVDDLLIRASDGCETVYDVDIVETLIDEFVTQTEKRDEVGCSDSSKAVVAKLIDGYLAEIAKIEPNLSPLKFIATAEKVSSFPRSSHDGVYRAIDMFLKVTSSLDQRSLAQLESSLVRMSAETKLILHDCGITQTISIHIPYEQKNKRLLRIYDFFFSYPFPLEMPQAQNLVFQKRKTMSLRNSICILYGFTGTSRNNKEREEVDMQINGLPETITGGMRSRCAKRTVTFTCRCADTLLRAGASYSETFSST